MLPYLLPAPRWRGCSVKAVRKRNKVLRLPVKPPTDFLAVLLRGSWRIRCDEGCQTMSNVISIAPLPMSLPSPVLYPASLNHPTFVVTPPTCSRSFLLASIACAGAAASFPAHCHIYPQFLARNSYKPFIPSKCLLKTSTTL